MTQEELIALVTAEVKGLSSYLVAADYTNASNSASKETGFSFPVTGDFKILWITERTKRHLFFMLMSESAHKFKFKQINLQNRFAHYNTLIKGMDERYADAISENPQEFAGVEGFRLFGTVAGTGHAYEPETGRNITHDSDQKVPLSPGDNS